ncbi:MAG TPA: hypothetical protein PK438_02765 [Clostridia bacterium]|nr:MAG: hypothetical protein BWY35_01012 [Firmicutes bacterium ADurb.Bin248]HOG00839.1 hypothetical protein [Clostridia bacterium]HOS18184.1 hypothetical protein [Clostridia bacterium]HPK14738.1 hypothetical protein [Clostridia bacterium]
MKKFLYIVLSLIAITGLIVALFARVPFDGGASPVAQANQREDLAVELSRDAFGVAPDTLSYSVTNNREVPVGVFRHASIERLAGGEWRALKMNLKNSRIADSDDMWYCVEIKPGATYDNWIFLKAYGNLFKRGEYRLVIGLFPYSEGSIDGFTEHVCSGNCEHFYMTAGFKIK